MAVHPQFELLGLTTQELTEILEARGQAPYRARQLYDALYRQRVAALEQISTLPQPLRSRLAAEGYRTGFPAIDQRFVSRDGTVRYLVRFSDAQTVETVWMPDGDGVEDTEDIASGAPPSTAKQPGAPPSTRRLCAAKVGEQPVTTRRAPAPAAGAASDRVAHIRPLLANVGTASASGGPSASPSATTRRATICLSSQAGCAVNCKFCMTALLGAQRNLTAGEIIGQVLLVLNDQQIELGRDRINLVFMGQGEPFLNYDNFIRAVRLLVEGAAIPESRMTVSTSGIVPRIASLAAEPVRPHLAISLNASNDTLRDRIMPINRKWNLAAILEAARQFPLRSRERLTFEYVLLSGVNDAPENAREVAALLRGIRAKVNLIALNPGPEIPFQTPSSSAVEAFQQVLIDAGIPAYLRRPRGLDIYAACGQLKRSTGLLSL